VSVAPGPIEGTVGGPTGRVFGRGGDQFPKIEKVVPVGRFGTVNDMCALLYCGAHG